MTKAITLLLTQDFYTTADFTTIFLHTLGMEVLQNDGKHNKVFATINAEIKKQLDIVGAPPINSDNRKLLFERDDYINLFIISDEEIVNKAQEEFLNYLESVLGYEIIIDDILTSQEKNLVLNQFRYTIPDFALILCNNLSIPIRTQSGMNSLDYKGFKKYLYKLLEDLNHNKSSKGLNIYNQVLLVKKSQYITDWLKNNYYIDSKIHISIFNIEMTYITNLYKYLAVSVFQSNNKKLIYQFNKDCEQLGIAYFIQKGTQKICD